LLQEPCQIVVDGQRGPHGDIMMRILLMSRHQ
jgi:hypothetical protein